jgi:hypothetical protein
VRRLALVLAVAAAAIAPAAARAGDPLASAYTKTSAAKTFKTVMTGKVSAGPIGIPFTARGETDNAGGVSHWDFDLSQAARSLGVAPASLRPELVVETKPPVMFVRWPLLARSLKTTKPWVKLDLAKLARSQPSLGQLSQLQQGTDVASALRLARLASGPVSTVGRETIRGDAATHYRTTVAYRKLAQTLPSTARKALVQAGARRAPLDIWVDGDGYLRRIAYSYAAVSQGTPIKTSTTFEFYAFDAPVSVGLPPAAQVGEPAALGG